MFGIPFYVAAATDSNQIVAASVSGTYAHWRVGNVDFKMGIYLLVGGFIGGLLCRAYQGTEGHGRCRLCHQITYVLMLGSVGTYMFIESLQSLKKKKTEDIKGKERFKNCKILRSLPMQTNFEKSGVTHSALVPVVLGGFVGVLAAIMGVGGGFLMVPVMFYILKMPMHVIVGTSLFQILFTCIEVTFLQSYTNHTVDFTLAVLC